MKFLFLRPLLFVALAGLLSSCASVSVKRSETVSKTPPRSKPDKIFVKPYTFNEARLRVDRSGAALETFKADASERMARTLVQRLSKHVAPSEVVSQNAPLPKGNFWLVTGRIDRIYQGSRLARSVIGYGIGGTKFETTSVIYDLSVRPPKPFLVIETTGGSNAAPGAIGSVGFFVSGVTSLAAIGNLLEGVRTGVTFDTIRTSKEISATVSEYLYAKRAIPHEVALAPKRPGRWQPDFWPFRNSPERLPEGSVTVVPAN
jgi:hypothetical protein